MPIKDKTKRVLYWRDYRKKNRDFVNRLSREHYQNNKERCKENRNRWRVKNRASINKKGREDYLIRKKECPEIEKEKNRAYYQKNKASFLSRGKVYIRTHNVRFMRLGYNARDRGLSMTITLDQYKEIINKPCHYCGMSLDGMSGGGLDRKKNYDGYTIENVVPCCKYCNKVKSDVLTCEEMEVAMIAVRELRLKNIIGGEKCSS